jgi:thiamine-monophosphate kinase
MRDEEGERFRFISSRSSRSPSQRGEFDFIHRIRRRALKAQKLIQRRDEAEARLSSFIPHASSLLYGIGDDAAIITHGRRGELVVTADMLVEEVDFRLDWTVPRLLGHKALAVSLSDVAAMGARPRWAMLSVGVPREIWETDFLDQFYDGFFSLAAEYGVALIGGDVSRTPERLVIDSVLLGESKPGRTTLRAGARAGDHIFVTGSLGGAAAGLRLLERGARLRRREGGPIKSRTRSAEAQAVEWLLLRHLRPAPRVLWGELLGTRKLATAMIDISDGLSADLSHLCRESEVGALIEAERVPVDPLISQLRDEQLDPLALALHGGEDFELLFTVAPRDLRRLPREVCGVPATYIGDVTNRRQGLTLLDGGRRRRLRPQGFSHF